MGGMAFKRARYLSFECSKLSKKWTAVLQFMCVVLILSFQSLKAFGHPVEEILSLRDGMRVEESILDRYDSKSIAESLVLRKIRHDGSLSEDGKYDFGRDTEIHLYFDSNNINGIKKLGFLNIFQMAERNRKNNRPLSTIPGYVARAKIESRAAGIDFTITDDGPYEKKLGAIRPKSAALFIPWNDNFGVLHSGLAGYGDVVAVLKNDVKKRALWTNGDSLEMLRDPKISVHTFNFKSNTPSSAYGYYEALIFGEIDASDVQEFRVPQHFDSQKLENLKQFGLPIYEYKEIDNRFVSEQEAMRTKEKNNFRRMRDRLIFPGNYGHTVMECRIIFAGR